MSHISWNRLLYATTRPSSPTTRIPSFVASRVPRSTDRYSSFSSASSWYVRLSTVSSRATCESSTPRRPRMGTNPPRTTNASMWGTIPPSQTAIPA